MNKDLHLLTLTPFFPVAGDDGRGCFVAEPLRALASMGVRTTTLACDPLYRPRVQPHPGMSGTWVRYPSIPGNAGLSVSGFLLGMRVLPSLKRRQSQERVDVIHAHGALPCGHAAALLASFLDIPFVVSVHGLDAFSRRQLRRSPGGALAARLSAHVYRRAARVICVSGAVAREVEKGMSGAASTTVLYNSVDLDLFGSNGAVSPSAPTVLSVGNLIPTKGHDAVLRALARVRQTIPDVRYEVIGDGPERPRLEALVTQLGLNGHVRFAGRQSRAGVADAMRRCTIFALPSTYEALGCVYLEAMAAGKPVIACRDQGISEVVRTGGNGWLVERDNPEDVARAIDTLVSQSSTRTQIGAEARRTIHERFGLHEQARQLKTVYHDAVAGRPPR